MAIENSGDLSLSNSGENRGVMANVVYGNIYNIQNERKKIPSLIPRIIEKLAELTNLSDEEIDRIYKVNEEDLRVYNIPEKITHNQLIKYRYTVEEYSQYGRICEEAFNILDNNNIGIKGKILKDISLLYDECRGDLLLRYRDEDLNLMDIIRKHADEIIEYVKEKLKERIIMDDNTTILIEDLNIGLIRIICYAFVECKILEKPR
ncbi:portal protein [Bacillus cereus]|uniref:portal protein n=1 Tax=Bacillus cereus group TaxID=86661 RepID=UPI000BF92AB4|nr:MULTISPECIES: portal protein [Bacillus cereus group]MDA1919828.1 hypothetical protein [Bacillus cereus group sp. BcHK140]PFI68965.1 portal protein [Bacillus cereus]PFN27336.1 portal protein [Bacillus cereus]